MKNALLALAVLATVAALGQTAEAGGKRARATKWGARFADQMSWHGDFYYTAAGRPVALVVPPTAKMQTGFSWGVAQTTMTPIYHQYATPYPGEFDMSAGEFRPTPRWPSHTDQFGVYYIRGPW